MDGNYIDRHIYKTKTEHLKVEHFTVHHLCLNNFLKARFRRPYNKSCFYEVQKERHSIMNSHVIKQERMKERREGERG